MAPNIGGFERLALAAVGAGLAASGIAGLLRRGPAPRHIGLALAGVSLFHRGVTGHWPASAALGASTVADRDDTRATLGGKRGIRVEESVTIGVPLVDLYRFWRDLQNLPRFMAHLESVRMLPGNLSHWTAKGPAGARMEWDAEIINEIPHQVIAWRSLEGADVTSAGSVRFTEDPEGRGTQVRVLLQYQPPAGRLGAALARLFGEEPAQQIREDLGRLKYLLETGQAPAQTGHASLS